MLLNKGGGSIEGANIVLLMLACLVEQNKSNSESISLFYSNQKNYIDMFLSISLRH